MTMAQSDGRSLNDIRRETEATRAALTQTVDELRNSITTTTHDVRERIKPASIKAEMSGYVRSRAEQMLNDAMDSARRNPLQAAAVFGSLAYPVFRLAKAVPVPLWLVGVGLYLAKSETVAHGAAELSEKASNLSSNALSAAKDAVDSVSGKLGETAERVGLGIDAGSKRMADLKASASDSMTEATGAAADLATNMSASASETASDAAEKLISTGRDAVQSAATSLSEAARTAGETASSAKDQVATTFVRAVEENPLLVAGIGLFVGAVIASALPRTDVEDEVLGGTGRSVKRRAQGAGATIDTAKEGIRRAGQQAEAERLDAEGMGEAARDIGQRVRRVAEAAVTTAFEPPEDNEQANAHGGRHNG